MTARGPAALIPLRSYSHLYERAEMLDYIQIELRIVRGMMHAGTACRTSDELLKFILDFPQHLLPLSHPIDLRLLLSQVLLCALEFSVQLYLELRKALHGWLYKSMNAQHRSQDLYLFEYP